MDIIEQLVRSFARRTTQAGQVVLITNGHPALIAAFHALGWSDPYVDPTLLPQPVRPSDTVAHSGTVTMTAVKPQKGR